MEMTRRGLEAADLARLSGLSAPTISAALAGRAVAARSLARLVRALMTAPVLDGIDELLMVDREIEGLD
jgi:hypothetical protein